MTPIRVAVVATHPVQYQVPWFRGLAALPELEMKVYYGLLPTPEQQGRGFGMPFSWDIPLLSGYQWEALPSSRRTPSLGGFWSNSTPVVSYALRVFDPDVLVLTGWNSLPLVQAWLAGLRQRIPMLMRAESNALRARAAWKRWLHKWYLGRIAMFVAIGRSNREFYLQSGVAPERIGTALYFVDNARIRAEYEQFAQTRAALRSEWGVPESAFCFLYAGKLEAKKRILDLLEAMREVVAKEPGGAHLLVVGSGEMMSKARRFSDTYRLPVSFAGFLNQTRMASGYAAADCLVLPSDYGETWGLVVNEAMVCGLPAIVSDRVGCTPDLIDEGTTGFTFPFGDVAALTRRMIELVRRPAFARRMGTEARTRIAEYSVEAAVAGTLEAILRIAGRSAD